MAEAGDDADDLAKALRAQLEAAVGSQYRIVRLLGRGGMGAVFLAREEALDRLVALKILPEGGADAESRERFRREARIAAQLNQANIVPLLGFGEIGRTMYLVMGYVNGESLGARLKRDARMGAEEARRILGDIAEALDYAHRRGVVHRDIKPDNILIDDETGRALLADFGIARGAGHGETVTRAGDVVGTPQYMSPEQARGAALDGRSDIYSLGAVGFAMLSGRPPFSGGSGQDVFLRRLVEDAPPLHSVVPQAPPELATVIDRCLARDPAARFPDARNLRLAIAPTALDDEQLPEPLDVLDSRGAGLTIGFIFALALTALALSQAIVEIRDHLGDPHGRIAGFIDGLLQPPTLIPAMVWALLALQMQLPIAAARDARARGFPTRDILFAFFRQPRGWRFLWYPKRFRRRDDVWTRLPKHFRNVRTSASIGIAALVVGVTNSVFLVLGDFVVAPWLAELGLLGSWFVQVVMTLFVSWFRLLVIVMMGAAIATVTHLVLAFRFMRTRGFDKFRLHRAASALLYGPTANRAIWRQPDLAGLLGPVGDADDAPPGSVSEYAPAISRLAMVGATESREVLLAAAREANQLAEEVAAVDRLLPTLERDADPGERARIDARLEAVPADSEERREMRELLLKERDLTRRAAERLDAARMARGRAIDSLNRLWAATRQVKSDPAAAGAAIRSVVRQDQAGHKDVEEPTRAY